MALKHLSRMKVAQIMAETHLKRGSSCVTWKRLSIDFFLVQRARGVLNITTNDVSRAR